MQEIEAAQEQEPRRDEIEVATLLRSNNARLALLNEVVLAPKKDNAVTSAAATLYTVSYYLQEAIETDGCLTGCSRFGTEAAEAFRAYAASWAALYGLFSAEELQSVPHADANGLSVSQLLHQPLLQPLVFSNYLARVRRHTNEAGLDAFIRLFADAFLAVCLLDPEAKTREETTRKELAMQLRHEKKAFLSSLFRPKPPAIFSQQSSYFGSVQLRLSTPQYPLRCQDVRLHLFHDMILIVQRDVPILLHRINTNRMVVSSRRVPDVMPSSNESSFSIFVDNGHGKVEHLVLFVASAEACLRAMTAIHATGVLRVNADQKKLVFLVRERKPFQGRSNQFGAEYHFGLWGFGTGTIYRLSPETGHRFASYKSRELEGAVLVPADNEGEHRVRISFSNNEVFDLASFGSTSTLMMLCDTVLQHRHATELAIRHRTRQPIIPISSLTRAEELKLREDLENAIRKDTVAAIQKQVHHRLGEIQSEYNDLSLQLMHREEEVRELQAALAGKEAPRVKDILSDMTPLERREYKEKVEDKTSVEFSEEEQH